MSDLSPTAEAKPAPRPQGRNSHKSKAYQAAMLAKPIVSTGRPAYVATKEARQMVTVFRSVGLPIPDIALQLGIDTRTLYKHFRDEMANGKATIVSRIGALVVKQALGGSLPAAVFYLKNHGGDAWKDKARIEHTGADGTALVPPNLVVSFLPMKLRDETDS